MSEFINTIDVLGDDAVIDSIIDRTITEFKDDKITKVGELSGPVFQNCTELTEVNLPNVTAMAGSVFYGCTSLKTVELPEWVDNLNYGGLFFVRCSSLESITLPKVKGVFNSMFQFCTALKRIDVHSATAWGSNVCQGCTELDTIILRNTTTVATMGAISNNIIHSKIAKGTGYIYVPRAFVDSYKAATNWSTYADQFRALEDYTVDGTTTGELDETKI